MKTANRAEMDREFTVTPAKVDGQLSLLPVRATATYAARNGKDLEFYVLDENRDPLWCKNDSRHRPIRATECICAQLGELLEIRTAGWRQVEYKGQSYFGSQNVLSSSMSFSLPEFLRSPDRSRYGGTSFQRGLYLGSVIALDMFLCNADRHLRNFIFVDDQSYRRLCVIDFADADLSTLTTDRFPIANSSTVELGRDVKAIHGGFLEGALQMLDRIRAIHPDAFRRVVAKVPDVWLQSDMRDRLNDTWGSSGFNGRLASLRAGLKSGALV